MLKDKKTSVLITSFGRLEKLLLFHLLENEKHFEVTGIVSEYKPADITYFLRFDSNHGKCKFNVSSQDGPKNKKIIFESSTKKKITINVFNPDVLALSELKKEKPDIIVDLSVDVKLKTLSRYAKVAKYVLASYQSDFKNSTSFQKMVFHFNQARLDPKKNIILVPPIEATNMAILLRFLKDKLAINSCTFDLICGSNRKFAILDSLTSDEKRLFGRSAFNNLVPNYSNSLVTTTSGLLNEEKISLPIGGNIVHTPSTTGALLNLKLNVRKLFKVSEINSLLKKEADSQINFSADHLVSQDIVSNHYYSVIDANLTKVLNDKDYQIIFLGLWFDTESSFVNSCLLTLQYLAGIKVKKNG